MRLLGAAAHVRARRESQRCGRRQHRHLYLSAPDSRLGGRWTSRFFRLDRSSWNAGLDPGWGVTERAPQPARLFLSLFASRAAPSRRLHRRGAARPRLSVRQSFLFRRRLDGKCPATGTFDNCRAAARTRCAIICWARQPKSPRCWSRSHQTSQPAAMHRGHPLRSAAPHSFRLARVIMGHAVIGRLSTARRDTSATCTSRSQLIPANISTRLTSTRPSLVWAHRWWRASETTWLGFSSASTSSA